MYRYQNVSDSTQTITASGDINPRVVNAGETCESSVPIENPNFKYIGEADAASVRATVTETSPNAVTEAQQVNNQTQEEQQ